MRTRFLKAFGSGLIAVALGAPAFAHGEGKTGTEKEERGRMGARTMPGQQAEAMPRLEGQLLLVDPVAESVVIRDPATQHPITLFLAGDTTIVIDGRRADLQQVREGQEARAAYELREGRPVAKRIEVSPQARRGPQQRQPTDEERHPALPEEIVPLE